MVVVFCFIVRKFGFIYTLASTDLAFSAASTSLVQEFGACPVTKESLSVEDLVPIKVNKVR
jgi:hypothetical protein